MDTKDIVAARVKRRENWVLVKEITEGDATRKQRVKYRRPPESAFGAMVIPIPGQTEKATLLVSLEDVKKYVVDWEGFTEADLIGAEMGGADPVAFHPSLFADVIEDNDAMLTKVSHAIVMCVADYLSARAALEKN